MPPSPLPVPVAHGGAGASWQALVTTLCAGVAVVFVLAVAGRIRLDEFDDLVLPLAVVVLLSAAAPVASATLSDLVGLAVPVGVVLLGALLVATLSPLSLGVRAGLTWAAVVVALVAAVALQGPLTQAWHPPEEPASGTAAVTPPSG